MNLILLYISKVFTLFSNFLILVIFTNKFGVEVAGYLTLAMTISNVVALADLGLFTLFYRDLNDGTIEQEVKASLLNFFTNIIVVIVVAICIKEILQFIYFEHNTNNTVFTFCILFFLFQFVLNINLAIESVIISATCNIIFSTLRIAIPIIFISSADSFFIYFYINSALIVLLGAVLLYQTFVKLKIKYNPYLFLNVKEYMSRNSKSFSCLALFTLSSTYIMNMDKIVLWLNADIENFGLYGIIFLTASLLFQFVAPLQMYFQPRLIRLVHIQGSFENEFKRYTTFVYYIVIASVTILVTNGNEILENVFDIDSTNIIKYFNILVFGTAIQATGVVIHSFAIVRKDFYFGYVYTVFCILNVVFLVVFTSSQENYLGISKFWTVSVVAANFCYFLYLYIKFGKDILKSIVIPTKRLVISSTVFAIAIVSMSFINLDNIWIYSELILKMMIGLVIFMNLLWLDQKALRSLK